jgi:hypothetical protein
VTIEYDIQGVFAPDNCPDSLTVPAAFFSPPEGKARGPRLLSIRRLGPILALEQRDNEILTMKSCTLSGRDGKLPAAGRITFAGDRRRRKRIWTAHTANAQQCFAYSPPEQLRSGIAPGFKGTTEYMISGKAEFFPWQGASSFLSEQPSPREYTSVSPRQTKLYGEQQYAQNDPK